MLELPPHLPKSPSFNDSPPWVSHFDFESSSDDEDADEDVNEPQSAFTLELEGDTPASHVRGVSDESDLSRWAPEPVHFPNQSTYAVNSPPTSRTQRSRSSASPSLQSMSDSTRRRKYHTLLGTTAEMVQRDVDFTIGALVSPEMFAKMLSDPLARQRYVSFSISPLR
jgi:hypothetical protein